MAPGLEESVEPVGVSITTEEIEFFKKIDKILHVDANVESGHEAYLTLKSNEEKFKNSYGFWWRYAMATHMEASAIGNGDQGLRKTLFFSAFTFAEKSLKLNDKCSEVHKWYAVTAGSKGEFLGINGRIQSGFILKNHTDLAVSINSNDQSLHYMLGRFSYEVSKITWIERKISSTIFSAPPCSTYEEALGYFQTAEKIGRPSKENRFFMAKCYIGLSDYKNAAHWLNAASSLPTNSTNDKTSELEIKKLLPKYSKYL